MGQGELAELRFHVVSSQKGFNISLPIDNKSKYDCILENEGKLFKVQVKSCSISHYHGKTNRYRVDISHGRTVKKPYDTKDVDYYAIYLIPDDEWFIIPSKEVVGMKMVGLSLNSNSKYFKFKDSWEFS